MVCVGKKSKACNHLHRVTCQMLLKDFASGEEQEKTLKRILEMY